MTKEEAAETLHGLIGLSTVLTAINSNTTRNALGMALAAMQAGSQEEANQRAQLALYGLLAEFEPWIGCDLTDHLAEALTVARQQAGSPVDPAAANIPRVCAKP